MAKDPFHHSSKFLSLVLRHDPAAAGITLDEQGWTDVQFLLEQLAQKGHPLGFDELQELVATNNKKRFAFSEDGTRIRASQGHSLAVDLRLEAQSPPEWLYHGTVAQHLDAIRPEGLKPMARQFLHLSADTETATIVGSRHGEAIVLAIESEKMYREGYAFYLSANGVWLSEGVPPEFIRFP